MSTVVAAVFGQSTGQGWVQFGELGTALVLSSLIGLERELKQKSAGLRTHTLVGLGSALFVLFSKYGFTDVLVEGRVVLDPSRVAAQIVSGIGFIGGGLIFVRRDIVRGLTTAAVVWVTCAVGCACGAGLPVLGGVVTAAHFLVLYGYPPLVQLLIRSRARSSVITVNYVDGRGVLREVLAISTAAGFSVAEVRTDRHTVEENGSTRASSPVSTAHTIDVRLRLIGGSQSLHDLVTTLSELAGVRSVHIGDVDDTSE